MKEMLSMKREAFHIK